MTLSVDHTHDPDLQFSRSRFESLIPDIDRPIGMERNGCESITHDHAGGLWVNIVVNADIWNRELGDFRRRRAIDTSSQDYVLSILIPLI